RGHRRTGNRPGGPLIAHHRPSSGTGDVKVAVEPKSQAAGGVQSSATAGHKLAEKGAVHPVVEQHPGGPLVADVKVEVAVAIGIRSENVSGGVLETAAEERNKVVHEFARDPAETGDAASHGMPRIAFVADTNVNIPVRPERESVGHVHLAALDE